MSGTHQRTWQQYHVAHLLITVQLDSAATGGHLARPRKQMSDGSGKPTREPPPGATGAHDPQPRYPEGRDTLLDENGPGQRRAAEG